MVHWKELNPENKSIPRPLTVVYKPEKGFCEYLVFSLDSKSILKSLWANRKIVKAMKGFKVNSEKEILEKIQTEINNLKKFIDFDIKIGINVDKSLELFSGKLTGEEMFSYLVGLVDAYNISYIESPFKSKKLTAKFVDAVKHTCLVENNSLNGDLNNSYLLGIKSVEKLKKEVETLKGLRITPIMKYENKDSVQLCCGLGIFILKHDGSDSEVLLQQLEQIMAEIKQS